MPPKERPPESPAALLWAHQLKREHGLLLDRMLKLEAAIDSVEKSATAAANKNQNDVDELAKQVQSLAADARKSQAIEQVQKDVLGSLEELHSKIEAITERVAQIDRDVEDAAAERKNVDVKGSALLKRVKETESSLKDYRDNMRALGQRINDGRAEQVAKQLDDLTRRAQKEGGKMTGIEEQMAVLEQAGKEIKQANERLAEELRVVRESIKQRAVVDSTAATTDDDLAAPEAATSVPIPALDWVSGARAGRVAKQKYLDETKAAHTQALPTARAVRAQKPAASKPVSDNAPAPKPAVRKVKAGNLAAQAAKKAAFDRTAAARAARAVKRKMSPQAEQVKAGPKAAKKRAAETHPPASLTIDAVSQKPILRAGRGWVEVEQTPSPDPEETPGHERGQSSEDEADKPFAAEDLYTQHSPRRVSIHRSIEQDDTASAPAPRQRRAIVQNDNTQAWAVFRGAGSKGKKRKANALADDSIDVDAPRQTRKKVGVAAMTTAKQERGKKAMRRGLTGLLTSPISSPPGSDELKTEEDEPVGDVGLKPPPSKKRRTIIQEDKSGLLRELTDGVLEV